MERNSSVDFPTAMRVHVALGVRDLARSVAFYRTLFASEPVKIREGYAKFELHEPPVNLTLKATERDVGSREPEHFGIQVKSTAEVVAHRDRMGESGYTTMNEEGVTCCFAVQDKVWVVDPDDHRWEIFVVLEADAPVHSRPASTGGELEHGRDAAGVTPAQQSGCCGSVASRDTTGESPI